MYSDCWARSPDLVMVIWWGPRLAPGLPPRLCGRLLGEGDEARMEVR